MTPDLSWSKVGVVIVTHNSERFLDRAIDCLLRQTLLPAHLAMVDSGSRSPDYVYAAGQQARQLIPALDVVTQDNIGFCAGSNLGYKRLREACDYVLFLNPDVFLGREALVGLLATLTAGERIGATTGLLLGYDIAKAAPTGRIDSAGIFRTWYGRWYDRYQGRRLDEVDLGPGREVPAITGALMLCRRESLQEVALPGGDVFAPEFFMYKEDIDLSLRLRRRGWRLRFAPDIRSFHCRGWQARAQMPKRFRIMSARNEIRVCLKNRDPRVLFSLAKYVYVKIFE
jgi:N-acetylglucosaminyl-diphospho-decaprenol L-rhamnosyltransferase